MKRRRLEGDREGEIHSYKKSSSNPGLESSSLCSLTIYHLVGGGERKMLGKYCDRASVEELVVPAGEKGYWGPTH